MQGALHLTYHQDNDGTGKLHAVVSANGFAGRGAAWFGDAQLATFADSLLAFPLPGDGLPLLKGGYWDKEQRGELEQLHLSLHFYPIGGRGTVGCRVVLRTPIAENEKVGDSVEVELRTSYQQLLEFSAKLKQLVKGEIREAVLSGVAV